MTFSLPGQLGVSLPFLPPVVKASSSGEYGAGADASRSRAESNGVTPVPVLPLPIFSGV